MSNPTPVRAGEDAEREATPKQIAAAWAAWRVRHPTLRLGPGPGFAEAIAAALNAEPSAAEAEISRLSKENDYLRASLANGAGPCPYCTLPKEDWAKCADGFPGCGRADDAMLCPNVGAWLDRQEVISRLEEALVRAADTLSACSGVLSNAGETVAMMEAAAEEALARAALTEGAPTDV